MINIVIAIASGALLSSGFWLAQISKMKKAAHRLQPPRSLPKLTTTVEHLCPWAGCRRALGYKGLYNGHEIDLVVHPEQCPYCKQWIKWFKPEQLFLRWKVEGDAPAAPALEHTPTGVQLVSR